MRAAAFVCFGLITTAFLRYCPATPGSHNIAHTGGTGDYNEARTASGSSARQRAGAHDRQTAG